MTKARMEIVEKMNQKKNDIKIMESENQNLTKRIESAKKDLDASKKSMGTAKEASDVCYFIQSSTEYYFSPFLPRSNFFTNISKINHDLKPQNRYFTRIVTYWSLRHRTGAILIFTF